MEKIKQELTKKIDKLAILPAERCQVPEKLRKYPGLIVVSESGLQFYFFPGDSVIEGRTEDCVVEDDALRFKFHDSVFVVPLPSPGCQKRTNAEKILLSYKNK